MADNYWNHFLEPYLFIMVKVLLNSIKFKWQSEFFPFFPSTFCQFLQFSLNLTLILCLLNCQCIPNVFTIIIMEFAWCFLLCTEKGNCFLSRISSLYIRTKFQATAKLCIKLMFLTGN